MLLSINGEFKNIYNCKTCSDEDKKYRGCAGPIDKELVSDGIFKIETCLYCGNTNSSGIEINQIISQYVHLQIVGMHPEIRQFRKWAASKSKPCPECNGSNQTKVWACPRRLADTGARLLPYFFDYYHSISMYSYSPVYPDGRSRIYQPLKLIQAFDLLAEIKANIDKKKEGTK